MCPRGELNHLPTPACIRLRCAGRGVGLIERRSGICPDVRRHRTCLGFPSVKELPEHGQSAQSLHVLG